MLPPIPRMAFNLTANCGAYNATNALTLRISDNDKQFLSLATGGLTTNGGVTGSVTFPTLTRLTASLTTTPASASGDTDVGYQTSGTASFDTARTLGLTVTINGDSQALTQINANWWK